MGDHERGSTAVRFATAGSSSPIELFGPIYEGSEIIRASFYGIYGEYHSRSAMGNGILQIMPLLYNSKTELFDK